MNVFDIVFDGGQVLYSGQRLSGKVLCHFTKSCYVKSIILNFEGKGNVEWTETVQQSQMNEGVEEYSYVETTIRNQETFLNKIFYFESDLAHLKRENGELPAGEHQFQFFFDIPTDIPSSFNGNFGCIKYTAEAKANLAAGNDIDCKKTFTVHNNMNVSYLPDTNVRIEKEGSKYICCFCCRTGPITCRCWLPKQGYKVGEQIPFSAEIENLSSRSMEKSHLQLIQTITYHGKASQKKVDSTVIYEADRPSFEREDYWTDYKIDVPDIPPSPFRGTKLIDVDYHIKMEVEVGPLEKNIVIKLPINIGSDIQTDMASLGQPNAQIGFSLPAQQPPQGEWAYHPMPGAPINPPYYSEPSAPHPSQGGYSYHPVPSDLASPPSYNEIFHNNERNTIEKK